ncbi:conserved exported hypothetical protein [Cupriavidus necator]|uniref:Type IV pilus biogenesis protein PilP n=1 Tax=Cupriavidus necator TaxID=106590 RepID=A0A1K0IIL4_CUPNE|nr:conserved exported hypothetical protein [Cupriavidus necator]
MQKLAFNLRWAPAALAFAAVVGLSVSVSANAASAMSNPVAAAIASAGSGTVTSQPASGPAAQAAMPATAATGSGSVAPATVAETAQPSRHTDAAELAVLQSQITLWKARAEIAKYKAEVKRAEESLTAAPAGAPPAAGVPSSISLAGPMPAGGIAERGPRLVSEAPRLVSLHGFDGHYNAMVDVNGRMVPIQAGDALDGGWKVMNIDASGVKLANGKRVRTLRP